MDKAIVLLADGLGAMALKASAGHARTIASLLRPGTTASVGFPTTTASALASLTTGEAAGTHGLVGYTVLDPQHDRVVNQLTGWDALLDPETWQRSRTVFERATDAGVPAFAVGVERYRNTGFTRAVLRGAEYRAAVSMEERLAEARRILDSSDRALVYVYVPELDQAGHKHGWQSGTWTDRLEELDDVVRVFAGALGRREGLILTADHGVVDVAARNHVLFDSDPALLDGIRHVAGEPRCLQLHFEADASASLRAAVTERWRESESGRSWVATRAEAVAEGWFGTSVHPEVQPRIGDLLVAARKSIAYYDGRDERGSGRAMVGQHGSMTQDELIVPLLRFGAFG
ncbi:MAG TPA: nucleotide pyrophosphatase/phosphodiesterase family protein [Homoserinimonas sp.]|nr:nucleotide pyrophosphatase/phosphodiesterase family protein [Homoserinimonas sp.]